MENPSKRSSAQKNNGGKGGRPLVYCQECSSISSNNSLISPLLLAMVGLLTQNGERIIQKMHLTIQTLTGPIKGDQKGLKIILMERNKLY
jgi:hypothetical protein